MTDLADFVESLKRAVATPGDFSAIYANATDDDLTGSLMDGFGECQLDGFFTPAFGGRLYELDVANGTVTPDITVAQRQLVVIYATGQLVTSRLLNLKSKVKYAAKGADYETEQSSNVLTALLKSIDQRKLLLRQRALYLGTSAAFSMADGYFLAATGRYYLAGTDSGHYYDTGGVAGSYGPGGP